MDEKTEMTNDEWKFLYMQGVTISRMPIEEWLAEIEETESTVDPKLYLKALKDILRGALAFKTAMLAARPLRTDIVTRPKS